MASRLTTAAALVAVALGVAGCGIFGRGGGGSAEEPIGEREQFIRGGDVIPGARGLVEVITDYSSCTGSMIDRFSVLFAAHCLDTVNPYSGADGRSPRPAMRARGSTTNVRIFYHDPDPRFGRRQIYQGQVNWFIPEEWRGRRRVEDVRHDLAIITAFNAPFTDVDNSDFLRIYAGDGAALDSPLQAFGNGIHSYSGRRDDNLRTALFNVEDVSEGAIEIDTSKFVGICAGDSGGPLVQPVVDAGATVPTVAGVASLMRVDTFGLVQEGPLCTNNDPGIRGRRDNAWYARPTVPVFEALAARALLTCTRVFSGSHPYIRCF